MNFKYFIIFSILVHFILLSGLYYIGESEDRTNKLNTIEISFADPEVEKQINPTLVVETEKETANDQLSEKTKFLSAKNNTVKKETKARTGTEFKNSRPQNSNAAQVTQSNQKKESLIFKNGFDAYASINKKNESSPQKNLTKNFDSPSTTTDRLEKIEEDLITRLNTKEYKYYGYYSRIKVQLNQWWVPKVQQKFTKMLRQGRTIASEENKVTKLVIVLNNVGYLVKVQVLAESGVRDLDDAAIEAFRQAAPFPNPPKGMIERDGTVKIRWDCVVEG